MTIALLDWAVLVVYFIVITGIGLIVGYRVRRTGEYFLGERKFGPWLMIGQSFSVGTHAEMPVALAGAVYIVFAVCFFIIETGSLLKGAGKVISQATGATTGVNEIVAAMTAMFILYSFVGGLVAS